MNWWKNLFHINSPHDHINSFCEQHDSAASTLCGQDRSILCNGWAVTAVKKRDDFWEEIHVFDASHRQEA